MRGGGGPVIDVDEKPKGEGGCACVSSYAKNWSGGGKRGGGGDRRIL
jgi:hypothetical protein